MSGHNQPASNYSEHRREIRVGITERLTVAELAKLCIEKSLEKDIYLRSDVSHYEGIPFHNDRRTQDERFVFKDARFDHLNIRLPRKDTDTKIRIEAIDAVTPGRIIWLEEMTPGHHPLLDDMFFVNDTRWETSAYDKRTTEPAMHRDQVAHWLLNQTGISEKEMRRKIKTETDPVLYAATTLAPRAAKRIDVRQTAIPLRSNLEFYSEIIEVIDVDNPLNAPLSRIYRAWINQHHDIDGQPVIEQVVVQFSPDDMLLGLDDSKITTVSVNIESYNPDVQAMTAAQTQAIDLEDGGVHALFAKVHDMIVTDSDE